MDDVNVGRLPHDDDDKDEHLIALLASGMSKVQASDECGVSTRTIRRRFENDDFVRKLNRARTALADEIMSAVVASSRSALDVLEQLMEAGMEPAIRLAAARTLLPEMRKIRTLEIEQRLVHLEAKVDSVGLDND